MVEFHSLALTVRVADLSMWTSGHTNVTQFAPCSQSYTTTHTHTLIPVRILTSKLPTWTWTCRASDTNTFTMKFVTENVQQLCGLGVDVVISASLKCTCFEHVLNMFVPECRTSSSVPADGRQVEFPLSAPPPPDSSSSCSPPLKAERQVIDSRRGVQVVEFTS